MYTKDKRQLNILYDADILANWSANCASRSGIFFVALNLLKEFLKFDNVKITLVCTITHYQSILKFRAECFPDKDIKIIVMDVPMYIANIFPYNNKVIKSIASAENPKRIQNNSKFKKMIKKILFYCLMNPIKNLFYFLNCINLLFTSNNYNVYFSACHKIPTWAKFNKHMKKYIVLHDTIPELFPEYSSEKVKSGFWYKELSDTFNNKDYYFAVSNNTKRDFLKLHPILNPAKIIVTNLACSNNFKPTGNFQIEKVKQKYNIPKDKKYIFSLCTLEPRKNLLRTVKTFIEFIRKNEIDDLLFVLGGGHWDEFISVLDNEIDELNIYKDKIIKLGYVDDEDLAPLYSGAEWFVYTSMYEGFGLPPLEAMSCGCPVITSNNSSLPEVVGDAGIMINYDNDSEHIKAYEDYYYDNDLRGKNKMNGLERAKQFSWKKCANIMYEQFCKDLNNENSI